MINKIAEVKLETKSVDAPAGVEIGGDSVTLFLDGDAIGTPQIIKAESVSPDTIAASFNIDKAGSYTVQMWRVAASGEAISDAITSNAVVVTPDQILVPSVVTLAIRDATIQVPAAVSLAVA